MQNTMNERLNKLQDDLANDRLSEVRSGMWAFIDHDQNGDYAEDIRDFVGDYLEKNNVTAAFYLVRKCLFKNTKNNAYTTLGGELLTSYAYNDDLGPDERIDAAYTATQFLPANSAAGILAAARLYDFLKSGLLEERMKDEKIYPLMRQMMIKSTADTKTRLHVSSIALWEHFLISAGKNDDISELTNIAKTLPETGTAQKTVLSRWEKQVGKINHNSVRSRGLHLTNAMIDPDMPDSYVHSAIKQWRSWRTDIRREDQTFKEMFLKAETLLATRLFTTEAEKNRQASTHAVLSLFKEDLCQELLKKYPYKPLKELGEKALLAAARYDGNNKDLREEIVRSLQAFLDDSPDPGANVTKKAHFHFDRHKAYLENSSGHNNNAGTAPTRPPKP